MARRTMSIPTFWSVLAPVNFSNARTARTRAIPPPATMPSATAARVAANASSTRSFFSFTSNSVIPPTLITATPPTSLAKRSDNFSRSYSLVASANRRRISSARAAMADLSPAPSTNSVASLLTTTFFALPRTAGVMFSSVMPISSEMMVAPVTMAISFNISLRRSPNPGALTAQTFSPPRRRFSTSVANASDSTSSAIINSGRPDCAIGSKIGNSACNPVIFFSETKICAPSNSASIFSLLVTKYGDIKPWSNCMPSTTSISVSSPLASSTVITPSLPTRSMAPAIFSPISRSELAEMVATWAISALFLTGRAWASISAITAQTAISIPRLTSIGFMPAAMTRRPSRINFWAKTVAVVVPSPALSPAFFATSWTMRAPTFSIGSFKETSLATVTPSLVATGAP